MTDSLDNHKDRGGRHSSPSNDAGQEPLRARGGLAPRGATPAVSALALDRLAHGQVARRAGEQAEVASLLVRLEAARARADVETEFSVSSRLARCLARDGRRLAEATKLARRSLLMAEDSELREELSGWFAGVGDFALAAGTLRPLLERVHDSSARAAIWMRIAVLSARDSDGERALAALRAASDADRSDPLPMELLGALHRWAPQVVTASASANAFFEAAARHLSRGNHSASTDALLQALEVEPSFLPAVEQLADRFNREGRFQATDELWRSAAQASSEAPTIHARRIRDALGAGDIATALGAALDQGADCGLDVDGISTAADLANDGSGTVPVPNFDGLLVPAGLSELLVARLELSAERHQGEERARVLLALARLVAGPLASARRATRALSDALVAAPTSDQIYRAVHDYALSTGNSGVAVEALLRCVHAGQSGELPEVVRVSCERLLALAEEEHVSLKTAAWALEQLRSIGDLDVRWGRLEERSRDAAGDAGNKWGEWANVTLAELRLAIEVLEQDPGRTTDYAHALEEMRRRDPEAVRWTRLLELVFIRRSDGQALEALWRDELSLSGGDHSSARLGLARLYRERGAPKKALESLLVSELELGPEEAACCAVLASLFGKNSERALALEQLAGGARSSVASVLLSVASGLLASDDDLTSARRLAEKACHMAPTAARPVVCYVEASGSALSRVTTVALERACEAFVPKVRWCRALAQHHPEPDVALRWLRRWASLSALELEASREFLGRLVDISQPQELVKGLDWLLGQPMPQAGLARGIASALELLVELLPSAARGLSRRLLGVFGVREDVITRALESAATELNEPLIRVSLLERKFAAQRGENSVELLELARLRSQLGQGDWAFDACERALAVGAERDDLIPVVADLPPPTTSDGELSALKVQLLLKTGISTDDGGEALAIAYREYGAALWDLASDTQAAIEAWEKASLLGAGRRDGGLARDLIAFCGYGRALDVLLEIATRREPADATALLTEAARVALDDGFSAEAMKLALRALEVQPHESGILQIIEESAGGDDTLVLVAAYQLAEAAVLGAYGERAIFYRAASFFEKRKELDRAFDYSMRAFEAVPGMSIVFALMLTLADRTGRESDAVGAMERVAASVASPKESALWLKRAAGVASSTPEGHRLRVDVLLRALTVGPSTEAIDGVEQALGTLIELDDQLRGQLLPVFDEVARKLLRQLQKPASAGIALGLARVAANIFQDGGLVAGALSRAIQLDASIDAPVAIESWQELLVARPGSARPLVEVALAVSLRGAPIAVEVLRMVTGVAERVMPEALPPLAVALAKQCPGDGAVVTRAEALCQGNPELLERLTQAVELSDESSALLSRAAVMASIAPEQAVELLESLAVRENTSPAHQANALSTLHELYQTLGNETALERTLTRLLEGETFNVESRQAAARALAERLTQRGAHSAALDVLRMIDSFATMSPADLLEAVVVAKSGGGAAGEIEFLERLLELEASGDRAVTQMRRLVTLYRQLGEDSQAVVWAKRILESDDTESGLFELVLQHAQQAQDWALHAKLLKQRIIGASSPPEAMVLQLADTLSAKLQDPAEAARVLGDVAAEAPSAIVLEKYAQCSEAIGELAAAGAAYQEAAGHVKEPRQAARLAELAVRAFLESGELEAAASVLGSKSIYPQTEPLAELRVQIAERKGDVAAHALALEELAFVSLASPAQRARLLRNAAELALQLGSKGQALSLAQRAARIAPTDPETQVYARWLEYRARGAGSPDEALTTISELRSLGPLTDDGLVELRSFLLAEALKIRVGAGAALRELADAEAKIGLRPLLALALLEGEQSLEPERCDAAISALKGGDIKGVREPEQVKALIEKVRSVDHLAVVSRRPRTSGSGDVHALPRPRSIGPSVAVMASGTPERGDTSASSVSEPYTFGLVSGSHASQPLKGPPRPLDETLQVQGSEAMAPQIDVAVQPDSRSFASTWTHDPGGNSGGSPSAPSTASMGRIAQELKGQTRLGMPTPPQLREGVGAATPPPPHDFAEPSPVGDLAATQLSYEHPTPSDAHISIPVASDGSMALRFRDIASSSGISLSTPSPEPDPVGAEESRPAISIGDAIRQNIEEISPVTRSEDSLMAKLEAGSFDAGKQLASRLTGKSDRAHDLVSVRRLMVNQAPGDLEAIGRLRDAVRGDSDAIGTRALDHILAAFGEPRSDLWIPAIEGQNSDSEELTKLLSGGQLDRTVAILHLLWQHVPHLFRAQTFPPGLHRIGKMSSLGRGFSAISRFLGGGRTALFRGDSAGPERHRVLLTEPLALVLDGASVDSQTTGEIDGVGTYRLGSLVFRTRPELVLLSALSKERAEMVIESVLAAFGPPRKLRGDVAQVAQFAESLWEGLSPGAQRRLQDLCAEPGEISLARARSAADRALARAGLIACGDLRVSVMELCRERGIGWAGSCDDALRRACQTDEVIADVVTFACSAAYAEARWRGIQSDSPAGGTS